MLNQLAVWAGYLSVVSGVLYTGWNEPLHYRFMPAEELAKARGQQLPTYSRQSKAPPNMRDLPASKSANWRPMGTALDRAPYDVQNGQVRFYSDYDHRKMGTVTETENVNGKLHTGPSQP